MRLSLVAIALASASCAVFGTPGSGVSATAQREVPAFKRLLVQGDFDVTVKAGARALSITTDDNQLGQVRSEVQDDTLVLGLGAGTPLLRPGRVKVELSNDTLEGLRAAGGATVTAPLTATKDLLVHATGGARLTLSGASAITTTVTASSGSSVTISGLSPDLSVVASGGSTVQSAELVAQRVSVRVSEGSSTTISASDQVTGVASEGSAVTVVGSPAIAVDATSGAHVTKR